MTAGTNAAPRPCSGIGSAVVAVHAIVLGLKDEPEMSVNVTLPLVPVAVCTLICDVLVTPCGTVVTMKRSVQSFAESAIVA